MKSRFILIALGALLFVSACFAQTQPSNSGSSVMNGNHGVGQQYPNLRAQAEVVTDAFVKGDFATFTDYTYPKVVEGMGGKEKMTAYLMSDSAQMKSDGFELLSLKIGEIKQIVNVEKELFAVLPTEMTLATPEGKILAERSILGISNDDGLNWKFIDGVSQEKFKSVFPKAAEKIQIPEGKQPILIGN